MFALSFDINFGNIREPKLCTASVFIFLLRVWSTISLCKKVGYFELELECLSHNLSPNQKIIFFKPSVSAECPPTTCCTS